MTTRGRHPSLGRVAICAIAMAWLVVLITPSDAAAQIGGKLGSILGKTKEVTDQLVITDQQEADIGAEVSQRIRDRYGVVQDADVHRYVSLVGTVLAQASSRPNLPWKFIVLDTDGVNAFAAPGGYIHITRGALALMNNEAELADALAHEIMHVTEKHTLAAIKKGRLIQTTADQANVTRGSEYFQKLVDVSTDLVLKGFGRAEELEADQKGIRLANRVGYAPAGLGDFLTRLSDRNKGSSAKQGLFASHPEMQERLDKLRKQIDSERLTSTATLPDRYRKFITYQPVAQSAIATVEAGAAGLTGDTGKPEAKKDDTRKDDPPPPKKKGFGLGSLLAPGPSEKKSAEVTGSAAARGVDKELGAKGGPVKTIVVVNLTPADIAAFKKEGNLK
jgi:beta-barrel assembly-enhancing protease